MKKKIWVLLLGILVLAIGVVIVGILKRNAEDRNTAEQKEAVHTVIESDEENMVETDGEPNEEQQYFEQLEKDKAKAGTIYSRDSYPIYNGFGFKIIDFKIFNTYKEFTESEYFNPDFVCYDPTKMNGFTEEELSETMLAYAEVEITNEDRYEKEYLVNNAVIICAGDGSKDKEGYYNFGGADNCYASMVDNWQDLNDEKERGYFHIEPGKSITIQIGTAVQYALDGRIVRADKVFDNPQYYLQVQGNVPSNGEQSVLEKDLTHIFIECQ